MGGVALVSFSSMDNPDEKGVIGNHGNRKLPATPSHRYWDLCDFEMCVMQVLCGRWLGPCCTPSTLSWSKGEWIGRISWTFPCSLVWKCGNAQTFCCTCCQAWTVFLPVFAPRLLQPLRPTDVWAGACCVSQGLWVCSTCCCCGPASSCSTTRASRPSSFPASWCGHTSSSTASLERFSQSFCGSGEHLIFELIHSHSCCESSNFTRCMKIPGAWPGPARCAIGTRNVSSWGGQVSHFNKYSAWNKLRNSIRSPLWGPNQNIYRRCCGHTDVHQVRAVWKERHTLYQWNTKKSEATIHHSVLSAEHNWNNSEELNGTNLIMF